MERAFRLRDDSYLSRRFSARIIALAIILLSACNEQFDPRAPLDEQLIVYSVLSTDRNVQIVRVQTSYMPSDFNALTYTSDNSITDAFVSIKESNKTYRLRDTLFARDDSLRYKFPMRAYYLGSFTPQRGKSYQVIVQSPSYGQVSSSVIVPDRPQIYSPPIVTQILDRPDRSPQDATIVFIVQLSKNARGYVGRLLLYYDVLKGSEWVEERAEIPITSADSSSYSLDIPIYPQLAIAPGTSQVGLMYKNGYYRGILNILNSRYKSTRLIFKWATLVLLQTDQNLFNYYSATHGTRIRSRSGLMNRCYQPSAEGLGWSERILSIRSSTSCLKTSGATDEATWTPHDRGFLGGRFACGVQPTV